jgi:hypothetical protein
LASALGGALLLLLLGLPFLALLFRVEPAACSPASPTAVLRRCG